MKQSDRIKYVQNYLNNPLRKEYETKEKEIMKNKPITYHILTVIAFFPLFMILGYFIIFILYENDLLKFLNFSDSFPIVLLGLINLPVAVFLPILLDDARTKTLTNHNKNALNKLKDQYYDKGLFVIKEEELYEHSCCEYDDIYEMYVCPITKKMIGYSDLNFCKSPGNCKYCKMFAVNLVGPQAAKYWGYEFKK